MPLIITATDFSDLAGNAVSYACSLARDQKADVLVIHSYQIPVIYSDVPVSGALINDTQNDSEEQMTKLINELQQSYPGLNIKGKVIYGDFIDAINENTDENTPLLVVLGNSSTDGNSSWPDSALMDALNLLKYPVLAVPPALTYKPIQKICFAFDNKPLDNIQILDQVSALSAMMQAELHILNIRSDMNSQDNKPDFIQPLKDKLAEGGGHYHMVFQAGNVDAAIHDFVYKNNMDLLVMIPRKHSFFEGLFHRSHTKAVAKTSEVPVLAIHDGLD